MKAYSVKGILSLFLAATSEALKTIKPNIWKGWSIKKKYGRMNMWTSFPSSLRMNTGYCSQYLPQRQRSIRYKSSYF